MTSLSIDLYSDQQLYDKLVLPIDLINIIYEYTIETNDEKIERISDAFLLANLSTIVSDTSFSYCARLERIITLNVKTNQCLIGNIIHIGKDSYLSLDDVSILLKFNKDLTIDKINYWLSLIDLGIDNFIYIASFLFAVYKLKYKL